MDLLSKNIKNITKHLEKKDVYPNGLNKHTICNILHFVNQCNKEGFEIIGMGYRMFDDSKVGSIDNMYEGGWFVNKTKQYS